MFFPVFDDANLDESAWIHVLEIQEAVASYIVVNRNRLCGLTGDAFVACLLSAVRSMQVELETQSSKTSEEFLNMYVRKHSQSVLDAIRSLSGASESEIMINTNSPFRIRRDAVVRCSRLSPKFRSYVLGRENR